MLLDTCFLIDLHREMKTGQLGPACSFIKRYSDVECSLSVVTVSEFMEGFESPDKAADLLEDYHWHTITSAVARRAGHLRRKLRLAGLHIGDVDYFIAATALEKQMPLVTANLKHFERIEGLEILDYRNT